jgi:hypothetical protein
MVDEIKIARCFFSTPSEVLYIMGTDISLLIYVTMKITSFLFIVSDRSPVPSLVKPTNLEYVSNALRSAAARCRHVFVDVRLPLASEYWTNTIVAVCALAQELVSCQLKFMLHIHLCRFSELFAGSKELDD